MTFARFGPLSLIIVGGALAALLFISRDRIWPSPALDSDPAALTNWERWHAFDRADRASHLADFRHVNRREDARRVLDNAAAFAALSASRQEELREINNLREEVIREQSADRQRWLNGLPGQARALELYRLIERDHPERLR